MEIIRAIKTNIIKGVDSKTEDLVKSALNNKISPEVILSDGLIAGMNEVGKLFEKGFYYVPEMLVSARRMQKAINILRPCLIEMGIPSKGKIALGTVKGDLHCIGKDLVGMMLEGAGFEILDLGTDVSEDKFLAAIEENGIQIIAMSALLTTTMGNMIQTIKVIEQSNLRKHVKIMVGGAPITQEFADQIGADGYAQDAHQAANLALRFVKTK